MRYAGFLTALVTLSLGDVGLLLSQDIGPDVEGFLQPYIDMGDFSGAVLIARGGQVMYRGAHGSADQERQDPMTTDTPVMIGSVSKQFTAAAILLLAQDGLLNPHDPVSAHLPGYPRGSEITIHHLLSHRAGLFSIDAAERYDPRQLGDVPLADLVALFRDRPLAFAPGTAYSYSNSGFVLLAHLIEVVSGKSYGTFLRERVFEPLEMSQSGHFAVGSPPADLARGYDPAGHRDVEAVPVSALSGLPGAGSIYSTVEDLYRWDRALYTEQPLSSVSRRMMFTDHGDGSGYGIGVYAQHGRVVVGHDGRWQGSIAAIDRFIDDDAAVIYVSNVQSGASGALRRGLSAIAFGEPYEVPLVRPASGPDISPARMSQMVGCYRFSPTLVVEVKIRDGRLWSRANRGFYSELVSQPDGTFFLRALYAGARFDWDSNGTVTGMAWLQGGGEFTSVKEGSDPTGCR